MTGTVPVFLHPSSASTRALRPASSEYPVYVVALRAAHLLVRDPPRCSPVARHIECSKTPAIPWGWGCSSCPAACPPFGDLRRPPVEASATGVGSTILHRRVRASRERSRRASLPALGQRAVGNAARGAGAVACRAQAERPHVAAHSSALLTRPPDPSTISSAAVTSLPELLEEGLVDFERLDGL